jgi:tRNA pseudouridine32 synthase/23S rRNA pseudouridine746 synthase/23S rRNA pseudouridine1911/1915/1917 synthase
MRDMQNNFKAPPKRYQPKGLAILYEDRDLLVVDKASGLLTVSTDKVSERTAYYLLTNYVRKGNPKSRHRVFVVHRLDRDTSGVVVFAKTPHAKNYLQKEWPRFQKRYGAVVHGRLPKKQGVITSYLAENRARKMYSVDDPARGKLARTAYKVLGTSHKYSLLEIDLLTGRKNQIRVHLADKGCPVVGDKKYGTGEKGIKRLMLHAASITLVHPHSEETMTFTAEMPAYFETLMNA